jgi:hypothetical protein
MAQQDVSKAADIRFHRNCVFIAARTQTLRVKRRKLQFVIVELVQILLEKSSP